ncbi:MAG: GNAT family N-acetyltransferase [Polyangiales bacterium]
MRIELLSAATQPRETRVYYEGLAHCYARFSADTASAGRSQVDRRAGLFFAMARERGQILGGCGIHVRNGAGSLPVERALPESLRLQQKLDRYRWTAELSGLWVKDDLRGSGVSLRLMQCAMAALPLLEVTIGVGFSHQHVLPLYGTIGLFPDPELSHFAYPDKRYSSSVLWADAVDLAGVDDENRAQILAARAVFAEGGRVQMKLEREPPRLSHRPPPAPPESSVPPTRPSIFPPPEADPALARLSTPQQGVALYRPEAT